MVQQIGPRQPEVNIRSIPAPRPAGDEQTFNDLAADLESVSVNPLLTPTRLPAADPATGERVSVDEVLATATRRVRWALPPGWRVRRGYTWDRLDRHDPAWWPQGVTCAAEAGRADRLLLVSWYSKAGDGVRITFLDLATRHYVHVPLALPHADGLAPLAAHAGGIAWRGPWLYVAATGRGCYVAHLDDLRRRPDGSLVWPVRLTYAADDGMRYSFLSLTDGGELLAGEYGGPQQPTRLARFALEPSGLLRLGEDGTARALGVDVGVPSMQGAALAAGRYRLMVSRGRRRPGDLWTGRPGALRVSSFAAPPGPEDVSYDPATRLLWSVTEFPGRRWIFALRSQ
jgi:hypothetical protein